MAIRIKNQFALLFLGAIFFLNSSTVPDHYSELDSVLNTLHEYQMLNGVVLFAVGDEIVYNKAFGKANFEWNIPNTTETRFQIASITKTFTAYLTILLAEEGLLNLDDVITDHLPDYPSETGNRITIEHLLEQSSGIPDYLNDPEFLRKEALLEHEPSGIIEYFADRGLEFEPGTDWNYGNSGYYLLGLIAQKVTGMPYSDIMESYVTEPLNLDDTGCAKSSSIIERLATGYVRNPIGYERSPFIHSSVGFSAGMMYSTATDLFRWSRTLFNGQHNESKYLERMVSRQIEDYGYGIFMGEQRIGDQTEFVISSFGNMPGYSSHLAYFEDKDYTLIILDNTQQCTNSIYFSIRELLFEQTPRIVQEPGSSLLASIIEEEGIEEAIEYFWEINETRAGECDFSIQEFIQLSNFYLERNNPQKASQILELGAAVHPGSSMIRDRLEVLNE